jgi:hypothetical protein
MVLSTVVPLLALSKEERLMLISSILVGVLLLGAVIISRLDRWRRRQMDALDDSAESAGSFRELYERGEITKGEYERVLQRVAERAGAKPKISAKPETPSEAPPSTPPSE